MIQKQCVHELLPGQCAICIKPPWGINTIVYTTKGGNCFHNWSECTYLETGQNYAYSQGMNNHMINPVQWSAVRDRRDPCKWCCAIYLSSENKQENCKANINNVWTDAIFIKYTVNSAKHKINQILVPGTGVVYFLLDSKIKF